jgi:hypothetical protein
MSGKDKQFPSRFSIETDLPKRVDLIIIKYRHVVFCFFYLFYLFYRILFIFLYAGRSSSYYRNRRRILKGSLELWKSEDFIKQ